MKEAEREERTRYMFTHVCSHTAKAWAREFVEVLESIPVQGAEPFAASASSSSLASLGSPSEATSNQMKTQLPAPLDVDALLTAFAQSKYRLIITGLAGIVSRAAALSRAAGSSGASPSASTRVLRSDYEENAGELWGWEESSPSHDGNPQQTQTQQSTDGATAASSGPTAAAAAGSSAASSSSASASRPAYIRGPSRYGSHTRRMSTFAQLPSSSKQAEAAMEEWMDMDGDGDADHSGEGSAGGAHGHSKDPTVEELKQAIVTLASDPNTTYLLLTSRTREWCDSLFASVQEPPPNLWFAAENGYFFKHTHHRQPVSNNNGGTGSTPTSNHANASAPSSSSSSSADWHVMYENVDFGWMEGVHRVMTYFCERTPRSYIQVQETSMQWHYGDAEPTFAKRQALDLISHLTGGPLSNTATEVLDSANIIQVRPLAVSKGRALKHLLAYLHKRYHRKGGAGGGRGKHWRRADTIASDSDEGEQGRLEGGDGADAVPAAGRSGLNAAAIQSALVESGVLITKEGETGGYEEDDEGGDEPQASRKPKTKAGGGAASSSNSLSLTSSPLHPPRGGLQIRSRRPSLADAADAPDMAAMEGGGGHLGHSIVLPIPTSPAVHSPSSSTAQSSSSSSSSYVPLDFVLCVSHPHSCTTSCCSSAVQPLTTASLSVCCALLLQVHRQLPGAGRGHLPCAERVGRPRLCASLARIRPLAGGRRWLSALHSLLSPSPSDADRPSLRLVARRQQRRQLHAAAARLPAVGPGWLRQWQWRAELVQEGQHRRPDLAYVRQLPQRHGVSIQRGGQRGLLLLHLLLPSPVYLHRHCRTPAQQSALRSAGPARGQRAHRAARRAHQQQQQQRAARAQPHRRCCSPRVRRLPRQGARRDGRRQAASSSCGQGTRAHHAQLSAIQRTTPHHQQHGYITHPPLLVTDMGSHAAGSAEG